MKLHRSNAIGGNGGIAPTRHIVRLIAIYPSGARWGLSSLPGVKTSSQGMPCLKQILLSFISSSLDAKESENLSIPIAPGTSSGARSSDSELLLDDVLSVGSDSVASYSDPESSPSGLIEGI